MFGSIFVEKTLLHTQVFYPPISLSSELPEAPDKPQIDDITANSMLVTWNEPNDNGSPILGYWVERREINSSHWARVNRFEITWTRTLYILYFCIEIFQSC